MLQSAMNRLFDDRREMITPVSEMARWKYTTNEEITISPLIVKDHLYIADKKGIYNLDKLSGEEIGAWMLPEPEEIPLDYHIDEDISFISTIDQAKKQVPCMLYPYLTRFSGPETGHLRRADDSHLVMRRFTWNHMVG